MSNYDQTLRILRTYFLLEGRLNRLDEVIELDGLAGTVEDEKEYQQFVSEKQLDKIIAQHTAKLRTSYDSRIENVPLELREVRPFKRLIGKIKLILK